MLHAVLHGKLDGLTPEPDRLEDSLTSTAFGTLVCVEAWDILAQWLISSSEDSDSDFECWFWPRMAQAEPDVVLRLGHTLVVVEAKYRSGRHDLAGRDDADAHLGDQLVRQYKNIVTPPGNRAAYPDRLEQAIRECQLVQIFLVDARRRRRAQQEYEESRARLPKDACLRLLTWQNLFPLLGTPALRERRWALDLRAYLEIVGLDAFQGIGRDLPVSDVRPLFSWRPRRVSNAFPEMALRIGRAPIAALASWSASSRLPAGKKASELIFRAIDSGNAESILEWRRKSRTVRLRNRKRRKK